MGRNKPKHLPWTPFELADMSHWREQYKRKTGQYPKSSHDAPTAIYLNSRYEVHIYKFAADEMPIGVAIVQLSIKRRDKREVHDWRDFQHIKNELVGSEVEAIEVYPAESRLVDTANQYHLWCFPEGMMAPVGYFDGRVVSEPDNPDGTCRGGAKQRPFEEKPVGAMSGDQIIKKLMGGKEPSPQFKEGVEASAKIVDHWHISKGGFTSLAWEIRKLIGTEDS